MFAMSSAPFILMITAGMVPDGTVPSQGPCDSQVCTPPAHCRYIPNECDCPNDNTVPSTRIGIMRPFDPQVSVPGDDPAVASLTNWSSYQNQLYIVQFSQQIRNPERAAITAHGGRFVHSLNPRTYLIYISQSDAAALATDPGVSWIGGYKSSYKITSETLDPANWTSSTSLTTPVQRVCLMLWPKADPERSAAHKILAGTGATVHTDTDRVGNYVEVTATFAQLVEIADMPFVTVISLATGFDVDTTAVRELTGINALAATPWNLSGVGVRGAVVEPNVRPYFDCVMPNDFLNHNCALTNIRTLTNCLETLPEFYVDHEDAHCTQTLSVLFHNGGYDCIANAFPCNAPTVPQPGILPNATGIFSSFAMRTQDLDQRLEDICSELVSGKHAMFINKSWGYDPTRCYAAQTQQMDEIVFENDVLIFQSMSNCGQNTGRPEAWSRNVVAVGGVGQGCDPATAETTICDDKWPTYNMYCPPNFGPASDGRIKPEVVHYYDKVTTLQGRAFQSYYFTSCPPRAFGTSVSTPLAAGNAGLMLEMWFKGMFPEHPAVATGQEFQNRPHAATLKALLVNSAYRYDLSEHYPDNMTRARQGWGRASAKRAADRAKWTLITDETDRLTFDEPVQEYRVWVPSRGSLPCPPLPSNGQTACEAFGEADDHSFNVTMAYTDRPTLAYVCPPRTNILWMEAQSPNGTVYYGNHGLTTSNWSEAGGGPDTRNNVQNVLLECPEGGFWTVRVHADHLFGDATTPPETGFGLVISGARRCVADVDDGTGDGTGPARPDGGVGIDDLLVYLAAFQNGNALIADVDDGTMTGTPDGNVGIEDLLYYLNRFEEGC